jgi:tetratricopeptide (TPR) repeat protein
MLKTEHYNISYTDMLPDVIDYPIELIKGMTEKLTIDINGTNLNSVFKWASLGKNILEKYTVISNKEIQEFRSALAWVLSDMSEYEKALEIANAIIKSLKNIKEGNSEIISSYYRLLSSIQNDCGGYKDALKNINKAIRFDKNSFNNYCVMGEIFINENKFKNAERALKIALERCIKQNGEDSPHAASIYQVCSRFYWQTKQENKCLEYAEKTYEIMKKHLGEENLYTARCLSHWGIYLFCKGQYKEAFKKMENQAKILTRIFEKKNKEIMCLNENVGRTLIKMNNHDEAFKYFENLLFIINDNADLLLALSYCNITMHAPELVCIINNRQIIDEIISKNNVECFTNDTVTNELYTVCKLFDTIPEKFYEVFANLFAKVIINKEK